MSDELKTYADMQRRYYDGSGKDNPEGVVGSYTYHENFPYETMLLFKNGDIRKPIFDDFKTRRAFDIGCGEGRMVRRMNVLFGQCDGADISKEMIAHARERTPGSSQFWVTNGADAGDAPSNAYDFAFCTISLQHICSFNVRDGIIKDLQRILKPDGKMTLQFLWSRQYPLVSVGYPAEVRDGNYAQAWKRDNTHALWEENKAGAASTNGACDVVLGPPEFEKAIAYFHRYFNEVEAWFWDISVARAPKILSGYHPNCHGNEDYHGTHFIFIHCAKPRK